MTTDQSEELDFFKVRRLGDGDEAEFTKLDVGEPNTYLLDD